MGWEVTDVRTCLLIPSTTEVGGWVMVEEKAVLLKPSTTEVSGWVMVEIKTVGLIPKATPGLCTPGATKCVGKDLYECSVGEKWVLKTKNATKCSGTPPEIPWAWIIGGSVAVFGIALLLKPSKKD